MQTSGTNVLLFFCAQILRDVKTPKGPFANDTTIIVKYKKKVVDSYSNMTNPLELSRKTRNDDPWKNTSLNHEIKCDAIHSYYAKRSNLIFD